MKLSYGDTILRCPVSQDYVDKFYGICKELGLAEKNLHKYGWVK